MPNSLDTDLAEHLSSPDLGPNYLRRHLPAKCDCVHFIVSQVLFAKMQYVNEYMIYDRVQYSCIY